MTNILVYSLSNTVIIAGEVAVCFLGWVFRNSNPVTKRIDGSIPPHLGCFLPPRECPEISYLAIYGPSRPNVTVSEVEMCIIIHGTPKEERMATAK